MVTAIQFAVRSSAGGTQHSSVAGEGQSNFIQVGSGDSVSLNLSRSSIVAYEQQGGDLVIKLVDGRSIVLSGYFNEAPGDTNHLYLSSEDEIVEVFVQETGNGVLFADYGPVSGWSKWSPLDDLRYTTADGVSEVLVASNEPAGMAPLVPGLLGLGGVGGAAAIIGGAVVVGGLHGGGGTKRTPPTVDAQPVTTVTTNTEDGSLHVSGTGQSGETVAVTIGTVTVTTTIGTDGKWAVTVPETGLPADGSYTATVVVTPSTGTPDTLTGPNFIIDLTPPAVSVVDGTKSTGDIENLVEYQDGVTITGQGEAGATIRVQIGTATQTTTVAANGSWSVTFTQSQVAAGEYEVPVTVTATDPLGNRTVITDTLVIDTVPHPIAFNPVTADNAVNLVESQSGLTVTGTSTAGATLTVTLQGVVQTTTVGADGRWSVTYAPGTLPGGEYTATLTATTVDVAGNTSSATHSFVVDTLTSVAFTGQVAGDNIVNATEAAGAIILTGTAQAGSTVSVAWNGTTLPATVGANGIWSVSFPGAAGGTYSSTAT
ncbi:MAG: BapA prefix-like domain-containing protein, partial [Rhodobacteraceae bacterium]|nr:BapA prefix-like domain-containing protein [Paracoccaceae bacterium]